MIGWGISRLAGLGARLLGASKEEANGIRIFVASITVPFDPIGGSLGLAHAMASQADADGSETGKQINQAMSLGSLVLMPGMDGLPDGLKSVEDADKS